jgi:hypothetical protein
MALFPATQGERSIGTSHTPDLAGLAEPGRPEPSPLHAHAHVWFQRIVALLLTSGHSSYAFLCRASQARWKRDLAAFLSLAKKGILHALGQAQSSI